MNYISLGPEVFFDEDGKFSVDILSQYCHLPTTKKFIYNGDIRGWSFKTLKFNNIVKIREVCTVDIAKQFPDLVEARFVSYFVAGVPDIGNLKSVNTFNMRFFFPSNIRNYLTVIDKNNFIFIGKNLNVRDSWQINNINDLNYRDYGL